jgi:N-sulfoglucosamine sulfohydrolase
MKKPPEFELYDLNNDPHEFTNLADNSAHQQTLIDLKTTLQKWRNKTKDPLLKEQNLTQLQSEINASFQNGKPEKSKLHLSYPDYFFKN